MGVLTKIGFRAGAERAAELSELRGLVAAMERSQAVIEFDLNGNILRANDNFLKTMGYGLHEIVGKHHSLFVPSSERDTEAYRDFWRKLGRGEYDSGAYRRLAK